MNFEIMTGEALKYNFPIFDSTGAPMNLVGATIVMAVTKYGATTNAIERNMLIVGTNAVDEITSTETEVLLGAGKHLVTVKAKVNGEVAELKHDCVTIYQSKIIGLL